MSEDVYDASDPETVKRANDEELDRVKDWAYLLKQPRGRRWLYELIYGRCHVAQQSLHMGGEVRGSDNLLTAFNEGGRAVGLSLLEEIRANYPEAHKLMHEENHYG